MFAMAFLQTEAAQISSIKSFGEQKKKLASTNVGLENVLSKYHLFLCKGCGHSEKGVHPKLEYLITHLKGCFTVKFLLGNNSSLEASPSRT